MIVQKQNTSLLASPSIVYRPTDKRPVIVILTTKNNLLLSGRIAMLDALIIHNPDGFLTFDVYRKPMHTNQYIPFNSYQPLSLKLFFCPRRNLNSVGDYSSSSVGVVCRVMSSVSNLKDGMFSKRFELGLKFCMVLMT